MPLCTIHLLSLHVPLKTFLTNLSSTSLKPLTIASVIRWIILPSSISVSPLLSLNIHWDILLILPSTSALPSSLQQQISHQYSLIAGVPSRLLFHYSEKNEKLLHPSPSTVPALTGSLKTPRINKDSAQDLELSPELRRWIDGFKNTKEGKGAVSMLNLLAFKPGMKEEYLKYGQAFAESAGSKRGGEAKIVGSVVYPNPDTNTNDNRKEREDTGDQKWDEIALAHYPSIEHFADMLASEDYQEINHKWRVGSLKDTCILFTSEIKIEEVRREMREKL